MIRKSREGFWLVQLHQSLVPAFAGMTTIFEQKYKFTSSRRRPGLGFLAIFQ
jgi:hypothetical protein